MTGISEKMKIRILILRFSYFVFHHRSRWLFFERFVLRLELLLQVFVLIKTYGTHVRVDLFGFIMFIVCLSRLR